MRFEVATDLGVIGSLFERVVRIGSERHHQVLRGRCRSHGVGELGSDCEILRHHTESKAAFEHAGHARCIST